MGPFSAGAQLNGSCQKAKDLQLAPLAKAQGGMTDATPSPREGPSEEATNHRIHPRHDEIIQT